jgi:hypothetical protein
VTDTQTDVVGPIDFLVLEAPAENPTGEAAEALMALVERGIVSIYDMLVIRKETDGSYSGIEVSDMDADSIGGFSSFARGARSGLVGDDDVAQVAATMEPGTIAAVIVYENTWARSFVAAAHKVGARVIASERIPAHVLLEVLDQLEAADA